MPHSGGVGLLREMRKVDHGRALPILVFSGTIASADEVREMAALGVAGYINEYTAEHHILPALAPHLFPDNFNRRGSPRVTLGIPISYRFANTIAAALTLNISKGGLAVRTMTPLQQGSTIKVAVPAARRQVRHRGGVARCLDESADRDGRAVRARRAGGPGGDRRVHRPALLQQPQGLTRRRRYSRSRRSALAMTSSDAPMSAATAIHSVAAPVIAITRNAAFSTSENAMFARMLRAVARLRRTA